MIILILTAKFFTKNKLLRGDIYQHTFNIIKCSMIKKTNVHDDYYANKKADDKKYHEPEYFVEIYHTNYSHLNI